MKYLDRFKSKKSILSLGKSFFENHRIIIVILSLALLIRGIYYIEIVNSPCVVLHQWDQSDMNFFHTWAGKIAKGEVLTNSSFHPFHEWHNQVAEKYLFSEQSSNEKNTTKAGNAAKRNLWIKWYGGKRFHQEPLYPYFIAIIYKIFGFHIEWVFLLQLVLGLMNILLMYRITKHFFGKSIAIVTALLITFSAPILFYEMVLLRTTCISFFSLLLVWLLVRVLKNESLFSWGKFGIVLGFAIVLKSVFLLLFIGLLG